MKKICLKAPAKINLGLSILKKLSSGYHEVKFIFQQVSLFDRIHLQEIKKDEIKVFCNDKNIPLNEVNTVYQAALLLKKVMKIKKGVVIKIDKKIPVAAGLGGGSSDAAQTLIGLNKIW
ncbi:MAG: 4-(cytidine 5'-diphospho)-2-C-methyl-D-erythritol kinase, partial [Candidatus Shapirobacteria bacterium]|nr:4-(cytidine 5'-diphospho)-2-C-methyl-D-erythritol kinase [Candidatus Shapirobacteria bacterium]